MSILLCVVLTSAGCHTTEPTGAIQSISLTGTLPPNLPGEFYGFWVETPQQIVKTMMDPNHPQHSGYYPFMVATFKVGVDGIIPPIDTTGFSSRFGVPFSIIARAEISIEPQTETTTPTSLFMVGSVTGSGDTGTALLRTNDDLAFGDSLKLIASQATLVSDGEVYLMKATDYNSASKSLTTLQRGLANGWQYGFWTIDSATTPPTYNFLGFVNAAGNPSTQRPGHFQSFPGGHLAQDTNLTTGHASLLLTLEPHDPSFPSPPTIPFGAPILWGAIPAGQQPYAPFNLTNVTSTHPTAIVKIKR